jgi:hypothetical protein
MMDLFASASSLFQGRKDYMRMLHLDKLMYQSPSQEHGYRSNGQMGKLEEADKLGYVVYTAGKLGYGVYTA